MASCNVDSLEKIGILFSRPIGCKGTVTLSLYKKNLLIYQGNAQIEQVVPGQWWYFKLEEPIKDVRRRLTLKFTVNYAEGSPLLGVYEDRKKISLVYKVLERLLNIRLPIHDLACINWIAGTTEEELEIPGLTPQGS